LKTTGYGRLAVQFTAARLDQRRWLSRAKIARRAFFARIETNGFGESPFRVAGGATPPLQLF